MGTGGVYRDQAEITRQRIRELERLVDRGREQLDDSVLAGIRGTGAQVAEVEAELARVPEGEEGLVLRLELLDQLNELLQRALRLAPMVAETLARLPDGAPDPERLGVPSPGIEPSWNRYYERESVNTWERMQEVADWVQALPGTLRDMSSSANKIKAAFRTEAGPFIVLARGGDEVLDGGLDLSSSSQIVVATGISRGAPRLRVYAEELRHTLLLKPLNLIMDQDLGNPSFDGQFIVEGEQEAARRLITREVQQALLLIARQDMPVLEVKPEAAYLYWDYDLTVAGVGAAVEALGAIRHASAVRG